MQNPASTSAARERVGWYHPGEIVIVAHVRRGTLDTAQMHGRLRERIGTVIPAAPDSLRSFAFEAPDEPMALAFFIQKLTDRESVRSVRDAVDTLHTQLTALSTDDMQMLSAMPHWHVKAHEGGFGGSPGSAPMPVPPSTVRERPRYDYLPVNAALKAGGAAGGSPIRVAILDTQWDFESALRHAEHFRDTANNQQLLETVTRLRDSVSDLHAYDAEWQSVGEYHTAARRAARAGGEGNAYHMPDHGLFIAGLVHAMAPHAQLSYEPVLDDLGVGDLSLLLVGLQRVLADKPANEPQIVNLSLGILPHPARLPAAWYGLERPYDPDYEHAADLVDDRFDPHWVVSNREHVDHKVDLLEKGLRELARYLKLNNCLVVAAAGNDSLVAADKGRVRMDPRLPARFETVLGVAATTRDPAEAAPYSNLGDERALGDHVATFGGSIDHQDRPENGVVGVYAGEFPDARARNETGWAYWSGTSFATGIISGMAANVWAAQPGLTASDVLAELHAAAGQYVAELRTPSIEVHGDWRA